MQFYPKTHQYYCGIDLHTNKMYLCTLDNNEDVLLHRNIKAEPRAFLQAIKPFREDLFVCAECMVSWYWLADLCAKENFLSFSVMPCTCEPFMAAKAKTIKLTP